ncbi:MAG TPA: hypothetical protein VF857_02305 [Spirochaetota bacterium]
MKKTFCALAALAAVAVFPALAMAETADGLVPYAQVRAYMGYVNQSKELTGSAADKDYSSRLTTSRFGVKGKSGDIDGVVEMGLDGVNNSDGTKSVKVSTRKIYATYAFTPDIKMLIGQDEAPYTFYSCSFANDDNFSGFGSTSQQRDYQAKVTLFGFYVDLLNPYTATKIANRKTNPAAPATPVDISYDAKYYDVTVPKIAVGYDFKFESDDKMTSFTLSPGAAYQTVKIDYKGDALNGEKINSYLAYCHATAKLGGFSVNGNIGYGVNTANMGLDYSKSYASAATSLGSSKAVNPLAEADKKTKDKITNTKSLEGFLDVGYDFGPAEVRGGVGYVQAKNDNWLKTDKQMAYYAQVSVPLVPKKLYIKPEFEYRNFMKDSAGKKQGNEWLAGAFIQAFL